MCILTFSLWWFLKNLFKVHAYSFLPYKIITIDSLEKKIHLDQLNVLIYVD